MKDIRSGAQEPADPALWSPPEDDLHPRIERIAREEEESTR